MKIFTVLICLMASQVCVGAPDQDGDPKTQLLTRHQVSPQTFDTLTHDLDPDQKSDAFKHMAKLKTPALKRDDLSCLIDLIGHARRKSRPFVTGWIQKVYPTSPQSLTAYFAPVRDILRQGNAGTLIRLSEKITLPDWTASDHMALLITMGSIPPEEPDHVIKYVLKVHPEPSTCEDAQTFIKQITAIPHEERAPLTTIARDMGIAHMKIADQFFLLDLLKGVKLSMRKQVTAWINEIISTDFRGVEAHFAPVVHALQDPQAETLISWARILFMSHKRIEPNPKDSYHNLMFRNILAAIWAIESNKRIDVIARARIKIQETAMTHVQLLNILKDMEKNPS